MKNTLLKSFYISLIAMVGFFWMLSLLTGGSYWEATQAGIILAFVRSGVEIIIETVYNK